MDEQTIRYPKPKIAGCMYKEYAANNRTYFSLGMIAMMNYLIKNYPADITGVAEKVIKEKLNVGMYENFIDKVIADSEMNICGMERL
jgi:hypothetical protein